MSASLSPSTIAENRFGLGARPDSAPPADPRGWLKDQLPRFVVRPAPVAAAGTSAEAVKAMASYRDELRRTKDADKTAMKAIGGRGGLRDEHLRQGAARVSAAISSPTPFAERLVHFWSNHFAVSADKFVVIGLAGLLEFEAIRPNLNRSFLDMWLAVMRHPAMLLYLDQAQSVGPNSRAAQLARNRQLGLNENLAREALELHSLGVRTGYAQADVTELARALTGWTVGGLARGPARMLTGDSPAGSFHFAAALHEPGARTVLGKRYPESGEEQARAILGDLARRPETARHIATKLARHFIADEPPPAVIDRLASVFLKTGGDLPSLHRALVDQPEAWAEARPKFKSPWDWTISALRGVGLTTADQRSVGALNELGQPVWRPGAPAGWADRMTAWAGPDALLRRVEVAQRVAAIAPPSLDARMLGSRLLGGVGPGTARVVAGAGSPAQGMALLFVSPEFLWR